MNDTVRGLVLLFSVVLWLPFLRPTLDGSMSIEQSVLRYAATLLIAWTGGSLLTALVRGYAEQAAQRESEQPEPEQAPGAPGASPKRRVEDRAS